MKTLDERRQEEWAFYRDLYRNHNYFKRTMRWDTIDQVCADYGSGEGWSKWLDVGCGGYVLKVPGGVSLTRTDPGNDTVQDSFAMHQLVEGYGKAAFDVVSSFDCLEHLFPEELQEAIICLWDVTRPGGRVIVSVGTDRGGPWNGKDVHLTQQPMEWWKDFLEKVLLVSVSHVATSKGTSPFFVAEKV